MISKDKFRKAHNKAHEMLNGKRPLTEKAEELKKEEPEAYKRCEEIINLPIENSPAMRGVGSIYPDEIDFNNCDPVTQESFGEYIDAFDLLGIPL